MKPDVPSYRLPNNAASGPLGPGSGAPEYLPGQEPSQMVFPDKPVMESYAGANNAYRGPEDHGVPTPAGDNTEMSPDGIEVYGVITEEFDRAFPDPDMHDNDNPPVPVQVVNFARKEIKVTDTFQIGVSDARAARILGEDPFRTRALILATPTLAYVGGQEVAANNGFPLNVAAMTAGNYFETYGQDELFYVCPTITTDPATFTTVYVLVERSVPVSNGD